MRRKLTKPIKLPTHIALRTDELAPLLMRWKMRNPKGQWAKLLTQGLRRELAAVATKRTRHLAAIPTNGHPKLCREAEMVQACLARLPSKVQAEILANPSGMTALKFQVLVALEWEAIWEAA